MAQDIQDEIEKVEWSDLLILNFPIFWFSAQDMLKGWIERVFLSGRLCSGKRFYDKGSMLCKKNLVTVTLVGQEHMFGPDAIHGEVQTMPRSILRVVLAYCGFAVLPLYIAYHIPYVSNDSRQSMLQTYQELLL